MTANVQGTHLFDALCCARRATLCLARVLAGLHVLFQIDSHGMKQVERVPLQVDLLGSVLCVYSKEVSRNGR